MINIKKGRDFAASFFGAFFGVLVPRPARYARSIFFAEVNELADNFGAFFGGLKEAISGSLRTSSLIPRLRATHLIGSTPMVYAMHDLIVSAGVPGSIGRMRMC